MIVNNKELLESVYKRNSYEINFHTDILPGDVFRFKTEHSGHPWSGEGLRECPWSVTTEDLFKITEMNIKIDNEGKQTILIGFCTQVDKREGEFGKWVRGIDPSIIEVVKKCEYADRDSDFTVNSVFEMGEVVWRFPNYMYESFTPRRYIIEGHQMNFKEYPAWKDRPATYSRWIAVSVVNEESEVYHHDSLPGMIMDVPYSDYRRDENGVTAVKYREPYLWPLELIKEEFIDNGNLGKFRYKTYANEYGDYREWVYKKLMEDIGLTLDDLKNAAYDDKKSKKKKSDSSGTKKKSSKKKKSDVEDIFNGLSEAQKKEMLKLLNKK